MIDIWSTLGRMLLERDFWLFVIKTQRDLGLSVPEGAIEAYERCRETINLESITARELSGQHDVLARLEEYNAIAGNYQALHRAMTSRDLTDNVEQTQILTSLKLVRDRCVSILAHFATRAIEYSTLDMCGRSHNVPGQETTLGKRFATCAEEMLVAFRLLESLINSYPMRGIKGPMGTQQDMLDLLGSSEKVLELERRLREKFGFASTLRSVGQIYPRSLDFETLSTLFQLAAGASNFATTMRLMAGNGLVIEGFSKGRKGSSAMPHKVNASKCERINGFMPVLGGFLNMVKSLVGNQWQEGDVSCSVVRRVALSGAFFTFDGLSETTLTVLNGMRAYPGMIKAELDCYRPFLATPSFIVAAMRQGMGREDAHTRIKDHAVPALEAMRESGANNDLLDRLARDPAFPLDKEELDEITHQLHHGLAPEQTQLVCDEIKGVVDRYPEAASYEPRPTL